MLFAPKELTAVDADVIAGRNGQRINDKFAFFIVLLEHLAQKSKQNLPNIQRQRVNAPVEATLA